MNLDNPTLGLIDIPKVVVHRISRSGFVITKWYRLWLSQRP